MIHLVTVLLTLSLPSPAHAEFASFAYNPKTGNWGSSFDESAVELARVKALKNCGSGCTTITATDYLGYAYLALDPQDHRIWGWGAGTWREDAYLRALQGCNERSAHSTCRIVTESDPDDGPAPTHGAAPWLSLWYCDTLTREDAANDGYPQNEYGDIWALNKTVAQQMSLSSCKKYEGKVCLVRIPCKLRFQDQR